MTPSHIFTQLRPAYALTKIAAATYFQLLALHVPAEKVQITSYHPGLIWNQEWEAAGFTRDDMDSGEFVTNVSNSFWMDVSLICVL
jgi:short-subunit dehydrogenase